MATIVKRLAVAAVVMLAPVLAWAGEKACCCAGCPCGM
jgi:hypothetical protein